MRLGMIAVALGLIVAAGSRPALAQDRVFTLLHTNDLHGRHTPFPVAPGDATAQTGDPGRDPAQFDRAAMIGGFAYLASAIETVRRREHDISVTQVGLVRRGVLTAPAMGMIRRIGPVAK